MMNPAEFENIDRVERDFWWFQGMNRILFHLLERELAGRAPRQLLETGCGTGGFATLLRQRWPSASVHVSDLAMEGLQFARERGLASRTQADIRALPYADASFGTVLSLDVIVHLKRGEEARALSELARVLRPGGLAVIRCSALDILHSRHSDFTHERQRFTRARLMRGAAEAGLIPKRCTYLNSFLMPVALAKFRLWEPLFGAKPASGLVQPPAWLNRMLSCGLTSELALLRRGIDLPLGQTVLLLARKR